MENMTNRELSSQRNLNAIDIPQGMQIFVPRGIRNQINAAKQANEYFRRDYIDLAKLLRESPDENTTAWCSSALFRVSASDEFIYFISTTIPEKDDPSTGLHFLRLAYDLDTGRVSQIIRDTGEGVFRAVLARFPQHSILAELKSRLNIPDPTAFDLAALQRYQDEANAFKAQIEELKTLSQDNFLTTTLIEDKKNTTSIHHVLQREYAVTGHDKKRWLATYGASDCYILGIYDSQSQIGALTHIDAVTDGQLTAEIMLRDISSGKYKTEATIRKSLKIIILGGSQDSIKDVTELYRHIKQWQTSLKDTDISFVVGPLFKGFGESLALDLETGDIQKFKPDPNPDIIEKAEARMRDLSNNSQGRQPAKQNNPSF